MRSLPRAAALLTAAAVLPLALTACSSDDTTDAAKSSAGKSSAAKSEDPDAGLATGARLKKALAPASFFGAGYSVDKSAARDTGTTYQEPTSDPAAVTKPDCAKLGGTSWIALTGDEGVSFAQNDYMNADTTADIAQEIDEFRGTTATTVMKHLVRAVAACPTYKDADTKSEVKVSGKATAGLGDDAYTVTLTDSVWDNGTTLIAVRKGTSVVTVMSTDGHDNGAATAGKLAKRVTDSL
ncbi:hypothetical protein GTY65_34550 [Streptomyces sp. SID8379]|uniref:hypothetical protein n=1 Tax=unclassified Streptomyces TaxID=2593676 RepID=UPI0003701538|nr:MULTISPECIES: hypothetical protein [unclassified Streptomyces]MYW69156.1 hypothetical protein [Streptomyces sp. SID8379]